MAQNPNSPTESSPDISWEYYALWKNVRKFVTDEVTTDFKSVVSISGISVGDIYTFGQTLSATVEEEFVRTLNLNRNEWDKDNNYEGTIFSRQSEVFPDLLLTKPNDIIFGIELKTWYLLAKEGEPSFRFRVTPKACADGDLLVVVPWVLSNVLSGSPIIFKPYVRQARYVAEYRNFWWQHLRNAKSDVTIEEPADVTKYPKGRERILDTPVYDPGNNFGRIARSRIMDDYVGELNSEILLGKRVHEWRDFFKGNSNPMPS